MDLLQKIHWVDGQNFIDYLWACASDALARRCYEASNCEKITEEILLKRMKKMSIRAGKYCGIPLDGTR